eukprot:14605467-Ditylum_brightwellii.AAC.1
MAPVIIELMTELCRGCVSSYDITAAYPYIYRKYGQLKYPCIRVQEITIFSVNLEVPGSKPVPGLP